MDKYIEMVKNHNEIDRAEKSALDKIWTALKNGDAFGRFDYWNYYDNKPLFYPGFWKQLYIIIGYNGKLYINWRHFGESAGEYSKKELKWIIEHIFDTTAADFLKEYTSYYHFRETTTAEDVKCMIEETAEKQQFNGNIYDYIAPDACIYTGNIY